MEYKVTCNGVFFGSSCDQYIMLNDYEYGFYEDDYICPNCQNQEEMYLNDWYDDDTDDAYALASAGHGMDEDY